MYDGRTGNGKPKSFDTGLGQPYENRACLFEPTGRNEHSAVAKTKLAGTGLRKIFGEELTGSDFLKIWPRIERSTISNYASDVIVRHHPCTMRFKGFTADGRAETLELLMLPLLPTRRNATHILATLAPVAEPYWLGDYPVVRTELISMRTLWVDGLPDVISAVPPKREIPRSGSRTKTSSSPAAPFQLIRGGID